MPLTATIIFFSDPMNDQTSCYNIHAKTLLHLAKPRWHALFPTRLPNQARLLPPHFRLWTPVTASKLWAIAACGRCLRVTCFAILRRKTLVNVTARGAKTTLTITEIYHSIQGRKHLGRTTLCVRAG